MKRKIIEKIIIGLGVIFFAFFFLYPFWISFWGALKTLPEIYGTEIFKPTLLPTFQPFIEVWLRIKSPMLISLQISLIVTFVSVFFGILGGYSLVVVKFKGINILVSLCVFGIYIPATTRILPIIKLIQFIKLYDTNLGVGIAVGCTLVPLSTILYRQFFKGIPKTFFEAAAISGANHLQILSKIVLPLSKIPSITVAVLSLSVGWNVILLPLILTTGSLETRPVAILLQQLYTEAQQFATFNEMLAGGILAALPPIIIYLIAQNYVTQGFRQLGGLDK
jgi:glucose/mannose transport system permease protein